MLKLINLIYTTFRSLSAEDSDGEKRALSVESLRMKKFSPPVENFLLQLALAENMLNCI